MSWTILLKVLIDKEDGIIAGHARVMAAIKLNLKEGPCIVLDKLSEAQKKAYIIADNKLSLNAGWNEELLNLEFSGTDDYTQGILNNLRA